ncbi:uncharacterized protein LOC129228151 [Uloborus diversus]|uniref:uncharacterized protein LOC129228151 n=1 Tax=Uloborus diversus TaxID=327109 RepID=UPI002409101C|nr:uncharacterized protein LOC129228151 [Uloborus diversus]
MGRFILSLSVFTAFWIYSVSAMPMDGEMTVEETNKTYSCLKESLTENLKMHFDMCVVNMNEANMSEEKNVLLCVLRTAGMIIEEEDKVDTMKMKMVEEEITDMKDLQQENVNAAVDKCEMTEDLKDSKSQDFVLCLLENLSMNCTMMENSMKMEEGSMAVEESEEAQAVL